MPSNPGEHAKRDTLRRHRRQTWLALCRRGLPLFLGLGLAGFTWPGRVPHLVYTLAHGSPSERVEALRQLPQYPGGATAQAVLSALEDADPEVQLEAARASAELGVAEAVPVLLSWLSSPRSEQQQSALSALGRLADARALPALERALHDGSPQLRLAAIEAVGSCARQGQASPDALAPSLGDADPALRTAALQALDGLQPLAAGTLAKLTERARDPEPQTRALALRVLARAQGPHSLPTLLHALDDGDERVRLAAIAALGDSGAAGAVQPLRARSAGKPADGRTALTALAALSRIDDAAAGAALAAQLTRPEVTPAALSALLARAERLDDAATWRASAAAVSGALAHATDDAQRASVVAALPQLARHTDASAAAPALLQNLRKEQGDPLQLSAALLALRTPELLPTLRERLEQSPAASPQLLAAAELALRDAPVAEAEQSALGKLFAARLPASPPAERPRLYRLLALTHTPGAGEPRPDDDAAARSALATWLGALPPSAAQKDTLVRLLRDPDDGVRRAATNALAQNADESSLRALLRELDAPAAREPVLLAITGALVHLDGGARLPADLRTQVFERLTAQLEAADAHVAASALDAMRALKDARAAPHVAQQLRTGSAARRASAVLALSDFDVPETRQLLRFVLQNESPKSGLQASLALAELGSERDAEALARAAERGIWPLPAAASYALARIAQRGVQKARAFERLLCRLGTHADPYVRANVAAGLAALGAEACDVRMSPEALLQSSGPAALRVAAARWLYASRNLEPAAAQRKQALTQCAGDRDADVAAACSGGDVPRAERGKLLLYALSADGVPWTERPIALRMPDGAVYVGPTDANAQVLLPHVPSREILVEDPAEEH